MGDHRLGYLFAESANVLALGEPSELQGQDCSVVTHAQQPLDSGGPGPDFNLLVCIDSCLVVNELSTSPE